MDIRVDNIEYAYPDNPVLNGITCQFPQGKFHVILGPNGSGKTTLLDIMSGFSMPSSGLVSIGGTPINTMPRREVAKHIALVSQSYTINFPFSVFDVVMMGRHPHIDRFSHPSVSDREIVQKAMKETGIYHLRHARITELSGGEKQRCVFARALCQETPILLLDEAFSNMDISHTLQLLKLLQKEVIHSNRTIIAVLHDLNLAAGWADTLLFLKSGRIMVQDQTEKAFTKENLQSVFNITAEVEFNEFTQTRQAFFKA